jgi:hypothetical protein
MSLAARRLVEFFESPAGADPALAYPLLAQIVRRRDNGADLAWVARTIHGNAAAVRAFRILQARMREELEMVLVTLLRRG